MAPFDADQAYILPGDVEFISIDALAGQTKSRFEHSETDIVLTLRNTRKRSKVLDEEAAALLRLFTSPQTWAEAILQRATLTQQDPQELAEEAFPLLMEMKDEGFLLPKAAEEKRISVKILQVGEAFQRYVIKEVCQVLEDSAVYRIEDSEGNQFVLKVFTPLNDSIIPQAYENEIAILEKLDGLVNPKLKEKGKHEGDYYFIAEWCTGMNCEDKASTYRNYNVQSNVLSMIDLCIAILRAYAHLHRQGVLHADIHTNNLLIGENNSVKIIDYGFSFTTDSQQRAGRGGIDFYYEPEMAAAWLEAKPFPPVTEKGEQYSLAVLLYRLVTGNPYLSFLYEPEKAYRQILEESPLPFSHFDLCLPAEFERAFCKALSKDPDQRFDSLEAFIQALLHCRSVVVSGNAFFVTNKKDPEKRFVQFLIRKYGWDSRLIRTGLSVAPTCSVNYGAAGIAYLFYRIACVKEDADLLQLACIWADRAGDYTQDYDKAFHTVDREISEATVGRRALYHSPTGVHVVQALIYACMDNKSLLQTAVGNYLTAAAKPCENLDLTLGKAGLLVGSSILLKELQPVDQINTKQLTQFTHSLMAELWDQLNSFPSMNQKNPVHYYGIAHGWGGLLYATLLWCTISQSPLPKGFHERTEQLLSHAIRQNAILKWPVSNDNGGSWSGWCHGNSGYVLLWSLFYQCFKEKRFLSQAEECARLLYYDQQQIGQLCCGLAGQAYAINKLLQLTGRETYRQKLEQIKIRMIHNLSSHQLRNNSLYKGEVGIGVLLAELQRPEIVRMPLFE